MRLQAVGESAPNSRESPALSLGVEMASAARDTCGADVPASCGGKCTEFAEKPGTFPGGGNYPAAPLGLLRKERQQQLRDLDGIGGGSLAEVVGHAPEVEAVGEGGVAADAADEDLVPALGIQGHGIDSGRRVILQDTARRRGNDGTDLPKVEIPGQLYID